MSSLNLVVTCNMVDEVQPCQTSINLSMLMVMDNQFKIVVSYSVSSNDHKIDSTNILNFALKTVTTNKMYLIKVNVVSRLIFLTRHYIVEGLQWVVGCKRTAYP